MVVYYTSFRSSWYAPLFGLDQDIAYLVRSAKASRECGPRVVEPNYHVERGEKDTTVELELPGVGVENVDIEVKENRLVVVGKRYDAREGQKAFAETSEEEKKDGAEEEPKGSNSISNSGNGSEEEVKPSVVYKFEARLSRNAYVEGISARKSGNGVVVVVVPVKEAKVRKLEVA